MQKSLAEIVSESMPQMQVVEAAPRGDSAPPSPPDACSPELADLRRRYFGDESGDAVPMMALGGAPSADSLDDPETGIVLVQPKGPATSSALPNIKAVVVADGKIVGRQG